MGLQTVMFLIAVGVATHGAGRNTDSSHPESLSLSVTPNICLSPCTVLARAWVERDSNNRWLTLIAESPEFRRASTEQLEGDRDARLHSMLFEDLDAGVYRIRVRLERAGGRVIVRDHVVEVTSGRR